MSDRKVGFSLLRSGLAVQVVAFRPVVLQYKGQKRRFSAISAMSASTESNHRLVLWFRNDLRLSDNAALQTAASMVQKKQATEVSSLSIKDRVKGL